VRSLVKGVSNDGAGKKQLEMKNVNCGYEPYGGLCIKFQMLVLSFQKDSNFKDAAHARSFCGIRKLVKRNL